MKITAQNAKSLYAEGMITYEEYQDVMIHGGTLFVPDIPIDN